MKWGVHNLHVPAVELDEDNSYSVQPGGPRFTVQPMNAGDGPAIFPEFDEAEEWRGKRLAEVVEQRRNDA